MSLPQTQTMNTLRRHTTTRAGLPLALALLLLTGCASGPDANPRDPLEPFNRSVYRFNDAIDSAVLKPVAQTYVKVTPSPVRTGVNNFFGNLGDLWSAVNAGLQLRPKETADNLLRFSFNTVFGLGGLLDSEAGIPRTRIDFGQTLGRWGVPSGAYVVLPFMGPSTVRDAGAGLVDAVGDPVGHVDHVPSRNSLYGLRIVDTRANLLRAEQILDGAALDRYSLLRDFYLGRRQRQIDDMIDKGIGTGDGD
jgi:phospholipid-binding lipoprotein MlaA